MATASLFPAQAKSAFLAVTRTAYGNLKRRLAKKKLPLVFSQDEFRAHILKEFMGGSYDGAVQCRYCFALIDITEVAFDHAIPLIRGGALELHNTEAICGPCNRRKGALLPAEYCALLSFLEREIPFGRSDVLSRLEKAVALAAGARRNATIIRGLKDTGVWPKRRAKEATELLEEAF